MTFRPKHYSIKVVSQQVRWAQQEMKRAENLLELCKLLPDILIPGKIECPIWGASSLVVPYDMKWYLEFVKDLQRSGWEQVKSYRDNWGDGDSSRYFTFKHSEGDIEFYINMDATDKDSVCQLIELGEKEVVKKEKVYEIICPEGENALSGKIA
jgi:hypothetical protein